MQILREEGQQAFKPLLDRHLTYFCIQRIAQPRSCLTSLGSKDRTNGNVEKLSTQGPLRSLPPRGGQIAHNCSPEYHLLQSLPEAVSMAIPIKRFAVAQSIAACRPPHPPPGTAMSQAHPALVDAQNASLAVESYINGGTDSIVRQVQRRDGSAAKSQVPTRGSPSGDRAAAFDAAWLRLTAVPSHDAHGARIRLVDLFAGCGGLSLGITEACRALQLGVDHLFAADINETALATYARNFPGVVTSSDPLESIVSELGSRTTARERSLERQLGDVDILAGGPPCQGNSDLNNHTRRHDPKNALFLVMVRFAEILRPRHVIIENVPGVRNDRRNVVQKGRQYLESFGYEVEEAVLAAADLGVAQKRRRYFMVASRVRRPDLTQLPRATTVRTVQWACEDLASHSTSLTLDSAATPSKKNQERINYLFDNDLYDLPDSQRPPCHRFKAHSYRAVYGRMRWNEPAPTITSGFNSPGQGRFVHPGQRRTLTPHEAARLQFLPDFFDWGNAGREALMQMIGNAVPPKLAYAVTLDLLR